ncbi:hypothetical protein ACFLY0_00640 [Patescibacteria group bacterium]
MVRVDTPDNSIPLPLKFCLDIRGLDHESILLMIGTVEGIFASGESLLGFMWDLQISNEQMDLVIGFNDAKDMNRLPVKLRSHNMVNVIPLKVSPVIRLTPLVEAA